MTSSSMEEWLAGLGCGHFAENFSRAGATLSLLPQLSDADLQAMGIATLGARRKIMCAAGEMDDDREGQENHPQRKTGSILSFLKGGATSAAALRAAKAPGQPEKSKGWAHANSAAGKQRWGGRAAAVVPIRSWQLVSGTNFVVDRFCNLPPATPQHRHWFLTHFHADHYRGLTSKFNRGTIYCTPITAALVRQQLRVPAHVLREVAVGETVTVEGTRVTFLPANHCPGAAMLLFEPPGRIPVLHSGDCRLTVAMQAVPQLAAIRGAVDLVLDTTYCDPQYDFPPQDEAVQFAVDAVRAEAFNPKTLFMFGSYTIGKERLYLEAAKALGRKVYVSATKKKILDCLALPPEDAALLTTDDSETNLHAVPLWMVSAKHMASALKFYRGRFTNVVGFQPTGWTHTREKKGGAKGGGGRRGQKKKTIITYQVPYSEHSSFVEMKEFVTWLNPRSVTPSVSNDCSGPKAGHMVRLLREPT